MPLLVVNTIDRKKRTISTCGRRDHLFTDENFESALIEGDGVKWREKSPHELILDSEERCMKERTCGEEMKVVLVVEKMVHRCRPHHPAAGAERKRKTQNPTPTDPKTHHSPIHKNNPIPLPAAILLLELKVEHPGPRGAL